MKTPRDINKDVEGQTTSTSSRRMRIRNVQGTHPHPPANAQVGHVLRLISKAHHTSETVKLQSFFTEADIVALQQKMVLPLHALSPTSLTTPPLSGFVPEGHWSEKSSKLLQKAGFHMSDMASLGTLPKKIIPFGMTKTQAHLIHAGEKIPIARRGLGFVQTPVIVKSATRGELSSNHIQVEMMNNSSTSEPQSSQADPTSASINNTQSESRRARRQGRQAQRRVSLMGHDEATQESHSVQQNSKQRVTLVSQRPQKSKMKSKVVHAPPTRQSVFSRLGPIPPISKTAMQSTRSTRQHRRLGGNHKEA
ncbi:hypothetical protein QJS10_CPA08g00145 [Acorus calamus]|uniref:Uncharacterized protein n=1 Tax=Acorus calamus TaxID=4465 RepID=A0AAV9EA85_ACOCL|nr:hypothetical protein QJS10_CPA08g00145 [Acorus calamus]